MSNTYDRVYNKWRNGICGSRAFVPMAALAVLMYASSGPVIASGMVPAISAGDTGYFIKVDSHADYRYRKVVKNGVVYYCQREAVTGTHLKKGEICLTEEQRKKLEEESQQQLRNLQRPAEDPPQVSPPPGT